MKKGFTLIEMLAVITLIGFIFILVIPKIATSLKNKKSDVDTTTNNIVISAAKSYVADNQDKFDKVDSNTYCLPISTLTKKEYLESPVKNVTDDKDITDSKSVKITYNKGFRYEIVDKKECNVSFVLRLATEILISKANDSSINNYTNGNTHQMYAFSHVATEQTSELMDYRYIGNSPYNYVKFNNEELWRIVGVFTVEDDSKNLKQRIKIVKDDYSDEKIAWDSSDSNEWSSSSLMTYFNGDYYAQFDSNSQPMIQEAKYYLAPCRSLVGDGSAYYSCERSNRTYSNRSKNWVGKIALLYPSDYIYTFSNGVDTDCFDDIDDCALKGKPDKSWMFDKDNKQDQWLITPRYTSLTGALTINSLGDIFGGSSVALKKYVKPVVYLSDNITIKSGNGTKKNPYKFKEIN